MLETLVQYLRHPYWCHANDIVPMVAMTPDEDWPLWHAEAIEDNRLRRYLIASLSYWQAFRRPNTARVGDWYAAFRRHLTRFILDVQGLPGARLCLSEISAAEIRRFAGALADRLVAFGLDAKGVNSCVLPSKTAHFFLLGLIPAYDQSVIRNWVLPTLLRRGRDMQTYVLASWWVLQQFREQGSLDDARAAVARYMLEDQLRWTCRLPQPAADHRLLMAMDSVIAEYTLIQMARNAGDNYVLRRA
jgi:hypothetical protein